MLQVLLLLCEDYKNLPTFADQGIIELCCEYQVSVTFAFMAILSS